MIVSTSWSECHNFPLVDSKITPVPTVKPFIELSVLFQAGCMPVGLGVNQAPCSSLVGTLPPFTSNSTCIS